MAAADLQCAMETGADVATERAGKRTKPAQFAAHVYNVEGINTTPRLRRLAP